MTRQKSSWRVFITTCLLFMAFVISPGNMTATQAAPSVPEYFGFLSQSVAPLSTWRITLTIDGLNGVMPPSPNWYDPGGSQVSAGCVGGSTLRDFVYSYGSLVQVKDYFYIRGCNREPGQYRVMVGAEIDSSFRIKAYNLYFPMVLRPVEEPMPPGAFARLSPADGATGQMTSLVLDWDDSRQASSYAYCYDTSDDGACTNWVDAGANSQTIVAGLSPDTTYFWQVRATNNLGTVYAGGDSNAYWSFTTGSSEIPPTEMIQIPAGEFQMGCDPDHNLGITCYTWDLPLHTVYLDAYAIAKNEVTNADYARCVMAGACAAPVEASSYTRPVYFGNPDFDQYPVVHVTWQDAYDYCAWAGMRLPTEAEWEKAGKGTSPQAFPWGDTGPTCSVVNFSASFSSQCVGDTNQVGSYLAGASPFGALDMAGNASEWVNDWYAADYYGASPSSNPPGPESGTKKVVRGGGYGNMDQDILVAGRSYGSPETDNVGRGFRCAASPAP
jgi:formylglycine-generating enzyme required for sulfatase activity